MERGERGKEAWGRREGEWKEVGRERGWQYEGPYLSINQATLPPTLFCSPKLWPVVKNVSTMVLPSAATQPITTSVLAIFPGLGENPTAT